jgi:hypothetical protein
MVFGTKGSHASIKNNDVLIAEARFVAVITAPLTNERTILSPPFFPALRARVMDNRLLKN